MRYIKKDEKRKRGCFECYDVIHSNKRSKRILCPYAECPYHELDGYNTYNEYMKATGETSVDGILKKMQKRSRCVTVCDHFPPRVTIWGRM